MQTYFVFVTAKGQMMTVPVANPESKVNFSVNPGTKVTSLCSKNEIAFLGTENGQILKVDMNNRRIVTKYDTCSSLPIINIKMVKDCVIAGTCKGELHVL